jgi:hypothetical protein
MTDQATMNARILDELINEKITAAQVDKAIISSVRHYRGRKFFFNQILDTLATVDGTEWYSAATTITDLSKLKKLLWANITLNSIKSPMRIRTVEYIDSVQYGSQEGVPYILGYGRQQLRLYPIPDDAYTIEFFAHYEFTEPTVAGNSTVAWFTHGEELIRCAAEKRLAYAILQAPDLAMEFNRMEMEALAVLDQETNEHEPDDVLRPESMPLGTRYGYDINVD